MDEGEKERIFCAAALLQQASSLLTAWTVAQCFDPLTAKDLLQSFPGSHPVAAWLGGGRGDYAPQRTFSRDAKAPKTL